jgi:hypothetical protein
MMFLVDEFLRLFICVGAVFIASSCVCAANKMGPHTDHWVRAAVAMLAAGAVGEICRAISSEHVSAAEALLVAGVLATIAVNRQSRKCPCVLQDRRTRTSIDFPPEKERRRDKHAPV